MKRMLIPLLAFLLLTACAPQTVPPYLTPSPTETGGPPAETGGPSAAPDTSPAPSAAVYPEEGWWRVNYLVGGFEKWWGHGTPDSPMFSLDGLFYFMNEQWGSVRSTTFRGEPLIINLLNGIRVDSPIPYVFLLLIDGLPARFYPNDADEAVYMFPLPVGNDDIYTDLTFIPELSAADGRADVVMVCYPMNTGLSNDHVSIHISNETPPLPAKSNWVSTSPLLEEISADPEWSVLWDMRPAGNDSRLLFNGKNIEINLSKEGPDWMYYAYTGLPGQFRTAFYLDYEPFPVYNGECFVDWSPQDGEMLQLPISFESVNHPSILTTVTIRMDDKMRHWTSKSPDDRKIVRP